MRSGEARREDLEVESTMQHENKSRSRSWRSFSKLTLLGPLALVFALGFWFLGPAADHPAPQGVPTRLLADG